MTELLRDLGVLVLLLSLLVGWLAVWRIGHVVSWRALATTAWVTRSLTDCVALIRFCTEAQERATESPARGRSRHMLEEWPRIS